VNRSKTEKGNISPFLGYKGAYAKHHEGLA